MADPLLSSAFLTQQLASAESGPNVKSVRTEAEAERVAEEFESFFLSQMVASMFSGLQGADGQFGGGAGEKAFSGLLHEEYAKVFAAQGGIGLADNLKAEILRMQGIELSKEQF
ncbi:MAG: chemotactic signal-response protein chel [Robiginitomaculum sp.]|nr:MAG: chemotactic signal-response protein chel [Robiginitomaculum sp.]